MERTKEIRGGQPPLHPGALLGEIVLPELKAQGYGKAKVAEMLGVGRQTLYDLIDQKAAVSPEMALKLGKLCGNGPDLWLALQTRFDLARERERLGGKLDAIPTLNVPASTFAVG